MNYKMLLLGLLLSLNFASGAMIYKVDNINIIAYPNDTLIYNLTITNNDSSDKEVYINKIFIENTFKNSQITIKPSINEIIKAKESKTFTIRIPVTKEMALGFYKTIYNTTLLVSYTDTGSAVTKTDRINLDAVILNKKAGSIGISITAESPATIIPSGPFNITITALSNIEPLRPLFTIIVLKDESTIYNESFSRNLSYGINILKEQISLPKSTSPGMYDITVKATINDESTEWRGSFNVLSYTVIKEQENSTENMLGKSISKTVINKGNEIASININYTSSLLESLLPTSATIRIISNGAVIQTLTPENRQGLISRNIALRPGETAQLTIHIDYTPLIILPLAVFGAILLWFFLTRKVTIDKEIIQLKKEGNEVTVKVGIRALNTSRKTLHNVKIVDILPLFAKKVGAFGSIRGEINPKERNINFAIGTLNPKEEVLITYKFKTDIELIGRVQLPPAAIKFRVNDEAGIVRSNTPLIQLS